jgi:cytochrome c5
LHGEKAMPPRGNCHECSDDELRAAMDYLIAQSVPGAD